MTKYSFLPILIMVSLLSCSKDSPDAPIAPVVPTFELAFTDDFNGSGLDLNTWYHRYPGPRGDATNDANAVTTDGNGNLVIKVYTDANNVHHTGMIATKQEFKYGKFEARIAFTNETGSWSAFWVQSATFGNPIGNPQQAGMEIDIVESLPKDGKVHQNIHWDGYAADHKTVGNITGDLGCNDGKFHIYTLEWTPTYYKFYVDGKLSWTYTSTISQKQEYIILSSEVKEMAGWAGPLPATGYGSITNPKSIMLVDYVKYYTLKQ